MDTFDRLFLGESAVFLSLLRTARIAARTDVTLLLLGESGTGKELLARAIHAESHRRKQPFNIIDCTTLTESLAESELFSRRDGGTLFLDEISELPLTVQSGLLHYLESGEHHSISEDKSEKINTRIIAASSRNLLDKVRAGRFREDLFYYLNIVPLQLPALRERHGDIEKLVPRLTAQMAQQHGLDAPRYSVAAMERLQRYDWPGNVRELRNLCERMLILLSGHVIKPENLPPEFRSQTTPIMTRGIFRLPEGGIVLEKLEADLIHQALDKSHGNQSKAARLLGLTRSALLYRMKKHAIV